MLSRQLFTRASLIVALAGTALVASFHSVPTTLAANPPVISATSPGEEEIQVTGRHFTPGGTVEILVTDANYTTTYYHNTTASRRICSVQGCTPGGRINTGFNVLPCWQTDHVRAFDEHSGQYSNWSNVYVYCVQ